MLAECGQSGVGAQVCPWPQLPIVGIAVPEDGVQVRIDLLECGDFVEDEGLVDRGVPAGSFNRASDSVFRGYSPATCRICSYSFWLIQKPAAVIRSSTIGFMEGMRLWCFASMRTPNNPTDLRPRTRGNQPPFALIQQKQVCFQLDRQCYRFCLTLVEF